MGRKAMPNGEQVTCPDDPRTMQEQTFCLASISKNLAGKIFDIEAKRRECRRPECTTLVATTHAELGVRSHGECDSRLARALDGTLELTEFVHVWGSSTDDHGFHSANFRWKGDGIVVSGSLSGMSSAGTHRAPAFEECQKCQAPGVDEGRLCGTVEEADDDDLKGAQVFGAHRLRYTVTDEGLEQGRLRGTFEGLVIRRCQD
jgi:hypothetical protein